MRQTSASLRTGCVFVAFASATGLSPAQPPQYAVTVLEHPGGSVSPSDVNQGQQVVGSFFNTATGYFDGLVWDSDGEFTVLSTAYGLDTAEGIGIRDDGTILAGATMDANDEVPHGAILRPDGTVSLLPSLAGDAGVVSAAFDMDDSGRVVGRSALVATPFWLTVPNDAVVWDEGAIASLGTLGGFWATARRINNNNVIIGESNTAASDFARGFVWTEEGGMEEIPPLEPGEFGHVSDLNDDDVIVGSATLGSASLACMWTDHTLPPALLETLPGDGNSAASGINDAGHIVGSAGTAQGPRARLWMEGEVYDLNDLLAEPLGYPVLSVSGITNTGVVLAHGDDGSPGFINLVLVPITCPADLDASGAVDVLDLVALLLAWGPCPAPCPEDLDGDGSVSVGDLVPLIAAWGPCS